MYALGYINVSAPHQMVDSLSMSQTSCVCPSHLYGSMPLNGALAPRKRGRSVIEEDPATTHTSSLQPPWKRVKKPFESQQKAITAFWDSLSKVSLTRHALKEHNRRNRLAANSVTPTPERRPDSSKGVGADCIKRFARHGGPDLSDLRGVSIVPLLTEFTADLVFISIQNPLQYSSLLRRCHQVSPLLGPDPSPQIPLAGLP